MKKEVIHPEGLIRRPFYSHVVKVGNAVHVAGQIARDKEGNLIAPGDFRAQGEKVFENLQIALKAAGAALSNVVSTTTYLTDMANLSVWAELLAKYFGTETPPTATVVVAGLTPGYLVELQVVAVVE